jgi:hypothetical protein
MNIVQADLSNWGINMIYPRRPQMLKKTRTTCFYAVSSENYAIQNSIQNYSIKFGSIFGGHDLVLF